MKRVWIVFVRHDTDNLPRFYFFNSKDAEDQAVHLRDQGLEVSILEHEQRELNQGAIDSIRGFLKNAEAADHYD